MCWQILKTTRRENKLQAQLRSFTFQTAKLTVESDRKHVQTSVEMLMKAHGANKDVAIRQFEEVVHSRGDMQVGSERELLQ